MVQKQQSVWKHKARHGRGERQVGAASELSSENEPPSFRAPSVFQTRRWGPQTTSWTIMMTQYAVFHMSIPTRALEYGRTALTETKRSDNILTQGENITKVKT